MTKMTKNQRRREKSRKVMRRQQKSVSSETSFVIKTVNGIEVAYATRTAEDTVSEKGAQDICRLSKIAIRQFDSEGRGSLLTISDANPDETVYLPTTKLLDCIQQVIPEALSTVKNTMNDYNPQKQFVMIIVPNRTRIAITVDALRFTIQKKKPK